VPRLGQQRQGEAWDIFLSASGVDKDQAERLYFLLETSYKVFYAPKTIKPGTAWEPAINEAIEHSQAMVVLFSQHSAWRQSKWMSAELQAVRERQQRDPSFRLIPLQLDIESAPSAEFFNDVQWLTAANGDLQDAALQIRRILGTTRIDESDRDRGTRIKAELAQALEEKAAIAERTERLQEELKKWSVERGMLQERADHLRLEVVSLRGELAKQKEGVIALDRRAARLSMFATHFILIAVVLMIVMGWRAWISPGAPSKELEATALAAASYEVRSYDKPLSIVLARTAVETEQNARAIAALRSALESELDPKTVGELAVADLVKKSMEVDSRELTIEERVKFLPE
jgi:hypothetical protein